MRIGIITQYYHSLNYGGNLQAYALCEFINSLGYNVEQISYDMKGRRIKRNKFDKFKNLALSQWHRLFYFFNDLPYRKKLKSRRSLILSFNNSIQHSSIIYRERNIKNANKVYDVFVTGSDQVWLPLSLDTAFFLNFANDDKYKMSYSASISKDKLTEQQLEDFRRNLFDFSAISVRERTAVELLSPISPVQVEWTLDPTMLLKREDWDKICTERIIDKPYLFCYFLGDDIIERSLAKEFACKNHLLLVTLPNLLGHGRKCDKEYGDEQLYNVSPRDFISLIKYADTIFTDSFHATVFSNIYKKQYFVFERSGAQAMSSRIYSLTELFETQDRFCDTVEKKSLQYILGVRKIEYKSDSRKLDELELRSKEYLINNLKRAKEILDAKSHLNY